MVYVSELSFALGREKTAPSLLEVFDAKFGQDMHPSESKTCSDETPGPPVAGHQSEPQPQENDGCVYIWCSN